MPGDVRLILGSGPFDKLREREGEAGCPVSLAASVGRLVASVRTRLQR